MHLGGKLWTRCVLAMCLLAVALPACTAADGERDDSGWSLFQKGMQACGRLQHSEAIDLLTRYYKDYLPKCDSNPNCQKTQVDVIMAIGECYYRMNNSTTAKEWFRLALDNYPDDQNALVRAKYWMGKCLQKDGNNTEAAALWQRILSDHPSEKTTCARTRLVLSSFFQGHGDSSKAWSFVQPLLDDATVNATPELLEELGLRLWTLGDKPNETRTTFEKLLQLAKNSWSPADYAVMRVRVASMYGDYVTAIAEADAAIRDCPAVLIDGQMSYLRAVAMKRSGRASESIAAFIDIASRYSERTDKLNRGIVASAMTQAGVMLAGQGQNEQARAKLVQVIQGFPDTGWATKCTSELQRLDQAQ